MSAGNKDIKDIHGYSASDIERYLDGDLSASEMHALEKAALDDPFLADALEGMDIHRSISGGTGIQQDLSDLQERLKKKMAAEHAAPVSRRGWPLFLRYAAAFILLAGLGITAYYGFFADRRPVMTSFAKTEGVSQSPPGNAPATAQPPAATAGSTATSTSGSTAASARQPATPSPPGPATTSTPGSTAAPSQRSATTSPSRSTSTAASGSRSGSKPVLPASPSLRQQEKPAPLRHQETQALTAESDFKKEDKGKAVVTQDLALRSATVTRGDSLSKAIPEQIVITGKVMDLSNHPLSGASLLVKGDAGINALTDKNGYFSLTLPTKDSSRRIVVNYTGYEPADVALNTENRRGNIIQLQPQPYSLNEVAVVGFGAKRKEFLRRNIDATEKPLSLVAVPASGWPAYNEYLASNKRLARVDTTIKGNEAITFLVNTTGRLSSFRVEQSLSPAHDSATIRMVREGPPWKLLKGKRSRARVVLAY